MGALALVVTGRLFGVFELYLLGAATAALVVAAVVRVRLARHNLAVRRSLHPNRVQAGSPSRVELQVDNRSRRPTPVLRLHDPVSGTRGAQLLAGPLDPTAGTSAAYRLPTERRGLVRVGPLQAVVTDPFGPPAVATTGAAATELTVYPRTDRLVALPPSGGNDPHAGTERRRALGRSGEDFHALRPYVVGDDLRRVHWPSTARHDDLMVRQEELPWQGRTTILLDVRASAHTGESLELAVSAAASVATAAWLRRDLVRLVTTDGTDGGFAAGHAHVEAAMEHLATVGASATASLHGSVGRLAAAPGAGALVAVVAGVADTDLAAIGELRRSFGSLTLVRFHPSSWEADAVDSGPTSLAGVLAVVVTAAAPFVDAWHRALSRPVTRVRRPLVAR